MTELQQKEKDAIELLRMMSITEPLYVCYSGGKDSDVIRILSEISGCRYELHHSITTVDAPETMEYVRSIVPRENLHAPERCMWKLIVDKQFPPTRIARYCCAELKEKGGAGRKKVTGVRWAESINRKHNQGLFTVIGKPKTIAKEAENKQVNFTLTERGGGAESG
jgi:phosphoadenosine phosphosulfate reductase